MKSRYVVFVSLTLVAILLLTGMTACTRAKPQRNGISEVSPTSVPGAEAGIVPTAESPATAVAGVQVPQAEVVTGPGAAETEQATTDADMPVIEVPTGEGLLGITPLPPLPIEQEPTPTLVPGMPTPTVEGIEIPIPTVRVILPPVTPEVELPPTPTAIPRVGDQEGQYYTVQEQDTLFSISVRFGTSIEELMLVNNMNDDLLSIGQELFIPVPPAPEEPTPIPQEVAAPPPAPSYVEPMGARPALQQGNIYVVQAGDNLFRIALRFGVSMDAIAEANNSVPPWYVIYTGQQLVIPLQ